MKIQNKIMAVLVAILMAIQVFGPIAVMAEIPDPLPGPQPNLFQWFVPDIEVVASPTHATTGTTIDLTMHFVNSSPPAGVVMGMLTWSAPVLAFPTYSSVGINNLMGVTEVDIPGWERMLFHWDTIGVDANIAPTGTVTLTFDIPAGTPMGLLGTITMETAIQSVDNTLDQINGALTGIGSGTITLLEPNGYIEYVIAPPGIGGPTPNPAITLAGTNRALNMTAPTRGNEDLNGTSTAVQFVGWAASANATIFAVGETLPSNMIRTVTDSINNGVTVVASETTYVYAIWGWDTTGTGTPDVLEESGTITFHLDGSGRPGGQNIVVPTILYDGYMHIVTNSTGWLEVSAIGNIYGTAALNQRIGPAMPRVDVGYVGANRWAGAFWGWFEQAELDPRLNGRNSGTALTNPFFIPLDGVGEPTRWRPSIGNTNRRVHPGVLGGPVYAMGEADGMNMTAALANGIPVARFDSNDNLDLFGIWIHWGDINDDGITDSSDASRLNEYAAALTLRLVGVPVALSPMHHGAADVALAGFASSVSASRSSMFVADLTLLLVGVPLPNPRRLGTETP